MSQELFDQFFRFCKSHTPILFVFLGIVFVLLSTFFMISSQGGRTASVLSAATGAPQ